MAFMQRIVAACSILLVTSAGVARSGQVDTLLNRPVSRKVLQQTGQDNPLYYVNLVLALSQTNRIEDAVDACGQALAAYHPENIADVYVRLGSLYFVQKQYRNALNAYQQAASY